MPPKRSITLTQAELRLMKVLWDRGESTVADMVTATSSEGELAYTSVLKRAIHTLWSVLDELDLAWIPVHRSWRLNERHYGALQGLNKAETAEKFGEAQVKIWRRSSPVFTFQRRIVASVMRTPSPRRWCGAPRSRARGCNSWRHIRWC